MKKSTKIILAAAAYLLLAAVANQMNRARYQAKTGSSVKVTWFTSFFSTALRPLHLIRILKGDIVQ